VHTNVGQRECLSAEDVPPIESDAEFLQSNQSSLEQQPEVTSDALVDIGREVDQRNGHLGKVAIALLIVLHNGFYAFAFEIVVASSCMLSHQAVPWQT
jgi:hypothetical protein